MDLDVKPVSRAFEEREAAEKLGPEPSFEKARESAVPDLIASMVQIPGKNYKMCSGGSWLFSARRCESPLLDWNSPSFRFNFLGFRLCASGRAD